MVGPRPSVVNVFMLAAFGVRSANLDRASGHTFRLCIKLPIDGALGGNYFVADLRRFVFPFSDAMRIMSVCMMVSGMIIEQLFIAK